MRELSSLNPQCWIPDPQTGPLTEMDEALPVGFHERPFVAVEA